MKKASALLLILAMVLSTVSCSQTAEHSAESVSEVQSEIIETTTEAEDTQTVSPTKLTNKMTENELQWVDKHELTLLDEIPKPNTDPKIGRASCRERV